MGTYSISKPAAVPGVLGQWIATEMSLFKNENKVLKQF